MTRRCDTDYTVDETINHDKIFNSCKLIFKYNMLTFTSIYKTLYAVHGFTVEFHCKSSKTWSEFINTFLHLFEKANFFLNLNTDFITLTTMSVLFFVGRKLKISKSEWCQGSSGGMGSDQLLYVKIAPQKQNNVNFEYTWITVMLTVKWE